MATTVHADRDQWRRRFRRGRVGTWCRTSNLKYRLSDAKGVDDVILVRSAYRRITQSYAPYIDNTIHTVIENWAPWLPGGQRFTARALKAEGEYLRGAAHIFTTSHLVARSVTGYHGVPAERVVVVGGGAHFAPVFSPEVDREPILLFAGYDFHRKGGDVLVRAFRRVHGERPACRLVIVGPELRLDEPGVECLGRVRDRDRIAALMGRASAFVLPARFEPYGMVLLEAMAHATPCVGANVGAIPEIIDDGRTGLIVPPDDAEALADALIDLLSDPRLAAQMGAAGRAKVVSELNWGAVAAKMVRALSGGGR